MKTYLALMAMAVIATGGVVMSMAEAGPSAFVATWDGEPASPTPLGGALSPANWDFAHPEFTRNAWEVMSTEGTHGHHGPDCSDPHHDGSGWHEFDGAFENAVYQCANHLMTYLGFGGGGSLYMTPNHLLDMSGGHGEVRVDVSTLWVNSRDWLDFWITPWEDVLSVPVRDDFGFYQGAPRNGIHFEQVGSPPNHGGWRIEVFRDYQQVLVRQGGPDLATGLTPCTGPDDPSTTCGPSAKNRQTLEIVLDNDHVKFWMPATGTVWADDDIEPLDWGLAVVQWGQHRYNAHPDKGCEAPVAGQECSNTWHWDNFEIDPAVPFRMVKADTRFVPSTGGSFNLVDPAPADAYLRWSAIGSVLLSFDGAPFIAAERRLASREVLASRNVFFESNYWTPIPEGTMHVDVMLAADGSNTGGYWKAEDFSVWSLTSEQQPTPTPTPSATPTPTITTSPTPTATEEPQGCELAMFEQGVELWRVPVPSC